MSSVKDIEREKMSKNPEAMDEDDADAEIKAVRFEESMKFARRSVSDFEESMKFARRSVSDADIRKYQALEAIKGLWK